MTDGEAPSTGEFGKTLGEHYDHLTKSEKRIANYLRRSQDEAAFLAAGELADRLGLSEATVVRFARTLGFANYPAMRAVRPGELPPPRDALRSAPGPTG